ncbi:unnamed protein product [Arabidopsis lyrata]|uniref:Predicted protein n=1 Tax=Arabidopsis lyrata subsp. lyrata TaxID=81972 RepID=D7MNB2_ARALL|nr:predicted protein [Arabidopsis lyrata subsp. lyrata]CAH8280011.1 unnamed protein product [Arabidopsis lyrata]
MRKVKAALTMVVMVKITFQVLDVTGKSTLIKEVLESMSPSGRRSPYHRVSPAGRRSPYRRVSPGGQSSSHGGKNRHVSPTGQSSLSNPSSDTDVNSNHENSPSKRGSDTYTLEEKDALKNFPGNEYPPGWDSKLDITWIGGDLSDAGVGFESLQIDDEDD